jgi:putative transposase
MGLHLSRIKRPHQGNTVPPRLRRYQASRHLHFITFSCQDRLPYLESSDSRDLFETVLESRRLRYGFEVYGYVVMPEHVHLLVSEPPIEPVSKAIASIKREVSRLSPDTPFWLPRYYDFNVFSVGKRIEKLRYIHRNPVHRGLTEKPEDYRWSSFRFYSLHEPGPVKIVPLY